MGVEVKFCGLTRAADLAHALALEVDYVGVVLGPSPRRLDVPSARRLLETMGAGTRPRRVGVFVDPTVDDVRRAVEALRLDAVQLHGTPSPDAVERMRRDSPVQVWRVLAVAPDPGVTRPSGPDWDAEVVLFDTSVAGRTGGTGRTFDWVRARPSLDAARRTCRVAVAGGLRPENVGAAIRALSPDIVDVSSGIESAPGIKDHQRMSEFVIAVRGREGA